MTPIFADVLRPTTTILAASADPEDGAFIVLGMTGFRAQANDILRVGDELVLVSGASGTDLHVVEGKRGWAGTAAGGHLAGARVTLIGVRL